MKQSSTEQQGINSIEVGLKVLKGIASLGRPAALREVAQAADMHPAKVHRYLVSWVRGGFVQQNPIDGHYDLGPYALKLGLACLARLDPVKIGRTAVEMLASTLNEPAFLAVWNNHQPTVVDWQPALRQFSPSTQIGTTFSLLHSSTGQVFAAFLPRQMSDPLVESELKAHPDNCSVDAPRTRDEVDTILSEVRERGLARGCGIRRRGLNSFSAPAFDHGGSLSCVLTAFGFEDTFDSSWSGSVALATRKMARQVSSQLGHQVSQESYG